MDIPDISNRTMRRHVGGSPIFNGLTGTNNLHLLYVQPLLKLGRGAGTIYEVFALRQLHSTDIEH